MALPKFRRFGVIEKVEEQLDGTLQVFGVASSEERDSDGEIILADAMSAARDDYMKWGAVREMHQPVAAGTALEAYVDLESKRTMIGVHVVDAAACEKVRTGVYKGFSIGGVVTSRDPNDRKTITGINWIETSLVDRPANPGAEILVVKAEHAAADAPEPEAPAMTDTIKKSMWDVGSFAELLQRLAWLCSDSANEAVYEADSSAVPAQLREWLAAGAGIFGAMAAEEVSELIAGLNASFPAISLAATNTDLAKAALARAPELAELDEIRKAGKRFSGGTKKALADIHEGMIAMCAKMDGLGYKDAEEPEEGEDAAKLAKLAGDVAEREDRLAKAAADRDDALAKAAAAETEKAAAITAKAEAEGALAKLNEQVADLVKAMKDKGVLRSVEKGADGAPPTKADEPIDPKDPEGPVKAMLKVHRSGGSPITAGRVGAGA